MRVLITGGMGVIGAETSRKFVKEGHRPVVFARHQHTSFIRQFPSPRTASLDIFTVFQSNAHRVLSTTFSGLTPPFHFER